MLFGNYYLYQCPECTNKISRGSLMSGNTFGVQYFSDGKRMAPMLIDFPQITKCDHCNTIFWMVDQESIGTTDPFECLDPNNNSESFQEARFLTIPEYFDALRMKEILTPNKERYLRLHIWWTFNDRVRLKKTKKNHSADQPVWKSEEERKAWTENAYFLEELLDEKDEDDLIMIAELNRNAGKFDRCMEIINTLDGEDLDWLKALFGQNCKAHNPFVFLLNPEEE